MDSDRWQDVRIAFQVVHGLGRDERGPELRRLFGYDPELVTEIESLLAYKETAEAEGFLAPPGAAAVADELDPALPRGSRVGPYEVQSLLGEGGMGRVYLAARVKDYRQLVALKVIRRDTGRALAKRFCIERQCLARLEHPNVVRLLDGGTTAADLLYLVMEYVEGEPLDDYCDRRGLTAGERARLLRDVARGVAFAHAHGVLHRDLKPRNVLVTNDGVPKVTDFGLARALGQAGEAGEAQTGEGELIGTPGYMSPEQVRGGAGLSGPAIDVYGLGATLYALLTGRPPFRGETLFDILRQIAGDEPLAPRRLTPGLPRDLETVCLKCLEKDPARRYPDVRSLATDLDAFLEGQPVTARPLGVSGRAWRWGRRRPSLAAALAALAAVTLGSFIGLTCLWSAARAERDRAETNFRLARRAVDDSLTAVSENDLLREPGMQPLREELLGRALGYYQEFLRRAGDGPVPRAELAAARLRLGQITQLIGSKEVALDHYATAVGILAGLATDDPQDLACRATLAQAHLGYGELLDQVGRPADADGAFVAAVNLWQELVGTRPGEPSYREWLGRALRGLAGHRANFGRREEAGRAMHAAGAFYRRMADAHPCVAAYRLGLADHEVGLGWLARDGGDAEAAEAAFVRAVGLWDGLSGPDPGIRHRRAWALYSLGALRRERGDRAGARQPLEDARAAWTPVVEADPRVTEYRDGLARCCHQLGLLERDAGHLEAALRLYGEVATHRERIAEHQPDWTANTLMLGLAYSCAGQVHHDAGRSGRARASYGRAARLYAESLARSPADTKVAVELAHLLANCPEGLARDPARALEVAERAVALDPRSGPARSALALALYRSGRWEAAARSARESMELQNGGAALEWVLTALALGRLGRTEEARPWLARAVAWAERNRPGDPFLRGLRGEAAGVLGLPIAGGEKTTLAKFS
jgi:serine/threonine protein kinase